MAEGINKSGVSTQFIEQKITKQVTVNAGAIGSVTVPIPQQAKAYLKGYGYTWATLNEFKLICGNQSFPMRTDQEGSTTIPVIYGNPFPVTSGDITLHISNGDSVNHDYTVVFYVLCDRVINTPSVGGELVLSVGSSAGSSSTYIVNAARTLSADVIARGDGRNALCVDTEMVLNADNVSIGNIKIGSTDQTLANDRYIAVDTNGKVILGAASAGTNIGDVKDISFTSLANSVQVTHTGAALQLTATSTPCRLVRIRAEDATYTYIGATGVSATNYVERINNVAGAYVDIPIDNANKLYIIGTNASTVQWCYFA